MRVQRSVEEIYEYAANLENLLEWAGAVSEPRKRTPEPLLESTPSHLSSPSPFYIGMLRW